MLRRSLAVFDHKIMEGSNSEGEELRLLIVILVGYIAGIAKVILSDGWGGFLLIPYSINFAMVACDACLYFRNARLDRENNSFSKA